MSDFGDRQHRIRALLYAGKPNWNIGRCGHSPLVRDEPLLRNPLACALRAARPVAWESVVRVLPHRQQN